MMNHRSIFKFIFWLIVSILFGTSLLISAVYLYLTPQLPDIQSLNQIELQIPLRVYSEDEKLISEFGEQRRRPLSYDEIPQDFIYALISAEDDRYFDHNGVDLKGLIRASIQLISTGKKKSGGSTITMQVAKNYYLSSSKTFSRKFTEILLALKIEQELTKEQILELYLNKIYLGKRAYGIEAAAQVYYGQSISELSLPQLAMIAGLPQAPSAANPINSPKRAKERRNYVLTRMFELEFITQQQYTEAIEAPIIASYHGVEPEVHAPYIAEMVRQQLYNEYGDDIYKLGFRVYTTIDSIAQNQANKALQAGLLRYDRSHGFRKSDNSTILDLVSSESDSDQKQPKNLPDALKLNTNINWLDTLDEWQSSLNNAGSHGLIRPAIVGHIDKTGAWVVSGQKHWERLPFEGVKWAKPYLSTNSFGHAPKKTSDVLTVGQQIWITDNSQYGIQLAQIPKAEGALIALDPQQGGIRALVGGFSFGLNKYNRVIQAERQPGSAFKPFIYSAALANGLTPASIINDAPIVFNDARLENAWRPENSGGKFYGPTRLREALYKSQNLVSIRILKQIGFRKAIDYISPFGFAKSKLNTDLSLALGASVVTPMELATGYTALANGGFKVNPYFINRIELGTEEEPLFVAKPAIVCAQCIDHNNSNDEENNTAPRIMDERTHYLINNMLQDVVKRGTARRALTLKRNDLAGKTGTTNDQKDAWFSGYNQDLVASVWVGFDQPSSLGRWAFGGNTALPIWVDFMKVALEGKEEKSFPRPDGLVSVRIDPDTGLLAQPGQENAIFELFKQEQLPARGESQENKNSFNEEESPQMMF